MLCTCGKVFETVVVNVELYIYSDFLYTLFRCSLKVVMSGELLTIHIRFVSKPSQKNAVSIPHARLIFSFY